MYKRKTNSKISFDIYRISDDTLAEHFEKEFNIDEVTYSTEIEAISLDGTLDEWADNVSKLKALEVAAFEIGSEVPDDLTITTLYGATFRAENIEGYGIETTEYGQTIENIKKEIEEYEKQRQQELLKAQQKQEKAEQKKKEKLERELQKAKEKPPIEPEERIIPVTIEEVPTTITIKKELSNINIIQISRLSKSITKLEKQKEEQQNYLNIALGSIERIQESGKLELMLGQIVTRDRFLDEINRTEIKIQKQKEAIEKIKSGSK